MHETQIRQSQLKTQISFISNDYAYDKTIVIGQGQTSVVYKGYNYLAAQIVACKIIQRSFYANHKNEIDRELSILQKISENIHENIMGFYGYQLIPDGMCFLLEYCEKGNLTNFLKEQKISEKNGLSMIYQIVSGMEHFNSHLGEEILMHRDLKPDNIFLTGDLTIKIGDFGLSRQYTEVQKTAVKGTPLYAAPELDGKNNKYDARCDVWSVGLIVYEILTGKKLYSDERGKQEFIRKLQLGVKAQLPAERYHKFWGNFLNLMLAFKPQDRKTFSQLKTILDENIEDIEKQIGQRYGYLRTKSTMTQSRNNSSSLLLSSIYQSFMRTSTNRNRINQSRHGLASILRALEEEQSYNRLNRCRKFLIYSLEMGQIYYSLIKMFSSNNDDAFTWGNVHKYMLMLLSVAAYVSKTNQILVQIKEKKIEVNKLFISRNNILQEHYGAFEETLESFKDDYSHYNKKYKKILQKQILKKIKSYEERPQTLQILLLNPPILEIKEQITKDTWRKEKDYLSEYRNLVNRQPIFLPLHVLREYDEFHVKQYYRIRLIAYAFMIFPEINYINSDYIMRKKEEIENSSKEEALLLIQDTYDV